MTALEIRIQRRKLLWRITAVVLSLTMLVGGITYVVMKRPFADDYELVDQLGGNLFPSAILSVATTNTQVIPPMSGEYVGNPKSCVAIKLKSGHANTVVRIELAETPFYARSVSTFVLPKERTEYIIYPDILWRYNALRDNEQAEPISVVANVEVDGKDLGQKVRTFSVRSINECLLGFNKQLPDGRTRYVSTRLFYAAYVNEENPLIDKVLREALNTRIVRRFLGYQSTPEMVDKQVYALWYVLQKRNFKYSSVSYSSLSSNVVYAQRVRTFEDALNSSQINCVDGSVLFASLLRAINITPVLVQMPGHMFVGYYTDSAKKNLTFLETTMIGDVDLDDYFPDEKLDSTRTTKSQGEMSRLTFEKSKEYALREYMRVKDKVQANKPNYLFVEINKNVRRNVQSIGK
ncbi:hypothetical protein [Prevotellamassilia timonensis]|jgi:hypothetical protein|uniref:hypothetical protein n=2 Tax=Prevotellamassilia timonensis TaxID=1852370 RepID=UPI0023F47F04|nr:hypothetical protein [Prevotellamassilia timonensis]MDD7440354.1 hypothetical protein [Prevotellamassilia timonensis]